MIEAKAYWAEPICKKQCAERKGESTRQPRPSMPGNTGVLAAIQDRIVTYLQHRSREYFSISRGACRSMLAR